MAEWRPRRAPRRSSASAPARFDQGLEFPPFCERDRSDLFDHHRAGRERLSHAGSNAKAAANRGLRDRGPLSRQRGPGQASVAPDRVRAARICGGGNFFRRRTSSAKRIAGGARLRSFARARSRARDRHALRDGRAALRDPLVPAKLCRLCRRRNPHWPFVPFPIVGILHSLAGWLALDRGLGSRDSFLETARAIAPLIMDCRCSAAFAPGRGVRDLHSSPAFSTLPALVNRAAELLRRRGAAPRARDKFLEGPRGARYWNLCQRVSCFGARSFPRVWSEHGRGLDCLPFKIALQQTSRGS